MIIIPIGQITIQYTNSATNLQQQITMQGKKKIKKIKANDINQSSSERQNNDNGQTNDVETSDRAYKSWLNEVAKPNGHQASKQSKDQMSKETKYDNARQIRRTVAKSFTDDYRKRLNMLEKELGVDNKIPRLFCQQRKQQVVNGASFITPIPLFQQPEKANFQISSGSSHPKCFSEYRPAQKQLPYFTNLQSTVNQNCPVSNTFIQPQQNHQKQVYHSCQPMNFERIQLPGNAENTTQVQFVQQPTQPTNSFSNQLGPINVSQSPLMPIPQYQQQPYQQQRQEQQISNGLYNQALLTNSAASFNNFQCTSNPTNLNQYYPNKHCFDNSNLVNDAAIIHGNQPVTQTRQNNNFLQITGKSQQRICSKSTNHYPFSSQSLQFLRLTKQINQSFSKMPQNNMSAQFNSLKIKDLRNFHPYFASLIYNMKVIQANLGQMKAFKDQTYQSFSQINKIGMQKLIKLKVAYSQQLQFNNFLHQQGRNLNLIFRQVTTLEPVATAYNQKKQHTFYNPDQDLIIFAQSLRQKFKKLKQQSQQAIKVKSRLSQFLPNLPQLLQDLIEYLQNNALRLDILLKKMSTIRNLIKCSSQGHEFAQLQRDMSKKTDEKWRGLNLLMELSQLLENKSKRQSIK